MSGGPGRLYQGTCGWGGKIFPPGTGSGASAKLKYYSKYFPCVEIDTSTYAIPSLDTVRSWIASVPAGFKFHIKVFGMLAARGGPLNSLPREVREEHGLEGNSNAFVTLQKLGKGVEEDLWAHFNAVCQELFVANKLGFVICQFHLNFHCTSSNMDYVKLCRSYLSSHFHMACEFRDREWIKEENILSVDMLLRAQGIVLIAADELAHETQQKDNEQTGLPIGEEVRILPIAWRVTNPALGLVIRLHRREGSKRVLSDDQRNAWVERLRGVYEQVQGPIVFLWGTEHEDQAIHNITNLKKAVEDYKMNAAWGVYKLPYQNKLTPFLVPHKRNDSISETKSTATSRNTVTNVESYPVASKVITGHVVTSNVSACSTPDHCESLVESPPKKSKTPCNEVSLSKRSNTSIARFFVEQTKDS